MPLIDFVKDRRNKIIVASVSAVGLIIMGKAGISALTPAHQVQDSNGQTMWSVNLAGQTTQSGAQANKSLLNCDTIDTTATGAFKCGTDATGGAGTGNFGTGNTITIGDSRYVNTSGDTMTGNLIVKATITGSHLYIGTISGAGLSSCPANQAEQYDPTTRRFACATIANGRITGTGSTNAVAFFNSPTNLSGSQLFTWNQAVKTLGISGSLIVRDRMIGSGGTLSLAKIGVPPYYTVQDFMNFAESPGVTSGGIITISGTTYTVGAGNGFIKATDSNVAPLNFIRWSGSSAALSSNTYTFLGVDYNGGSPKVISKATDTFDLDTQFSLGVVVNDAGTVYKMNNDWHTGDTIANIIERLDSDATIQRDARQGGLILGNTGTRNITVSAGQILARVAEFAIAAFDSSAASTFDTYYQNGAGGWTKATGVTQWDNTNYDDGDGTLGSVTALQYSSKWFYLMSDGTVAMMYGQSVSTALGTIISSDTPPSTVPNRIGKTGLLIGRIVFHGSNSTPDAVQSAFTSTFNPTLVTDHNALSNLTTGDPHTQYMYLAGRAGGQALVGGTAATDTISLKSSSVAGAVAVTILGTNMGIGTAAPKAKLHVIGSGAFTGTVSGSALNIQGGNSTIYGNVSIGRNRNLAVLSVTGSVIIGSGRLIVVLPRSNGIETQAPPYSDFDIARFIHLGNSGSYAGVLVQNSATMNATSDFYAQNSAASDTTGFIDQGFTSQTYNVAGGGLIGPNEGYLYTGNSPISIGSGNSGSAIRFWMTDHGLPAQMAVPTSAEKMRIDGPGGYVGINTKTVKPKARLTVFGSGAFTGTLSGSSIRAQTDLTSSGRLIVKTSANFEWLGTCAFLASSVGSVTCGTTLAVANGGTALTSLPSRDIILTAAGATPTTNSGSVAKNVFLSTNQTNVQTQDFTSSGTTITTHSAQWMTVMPASWDGGTIAFQFNWFTGNVSGNVHWYIQCVGYADASAMDLPWGASGSVVSSAKSTANQMIISGTTGPVTCGGTPAGGKPVFFRVFRKTQAKDGQDTLAGTGRLVNVFGKYSTNSYTD